MSKEGNNLQEVYNAIDKGLELAKANPLKGLFAFTAKPSKVLELSRRKKRFGWAWLPS